jgi:phosphatidylglycerol lysyltransferase
VTLGLSALAGRSSGWFAVARRLAAQLYDFQGLHAFRAKLHPDRWDPIYISSNDRRFAGAVTGSVAIFDALKAFARGRLVAFGVATLLRGPALVVRLLAALLVPWTVLLALSSGRWFPGPGVHAAWVAFDTVLAAALFALAARWRRWLGLVLAVAVTADAGLTAAQVALYNLPRARGPGDWLVCAVAMAAPTVAGLILWNAINHRRRARRV